MSTPEARVWCERRVLHDAGGLLVVDKPPGISVHGGRQGLPEDLVKRLGLWLSGRGEPTYLGVHQRLDKATSGVLVLARGEAQNEELHRAFEKREAKKQYVAVSSAGGRRAPPVEGLWEDHLSELLRGRVSVVKRGGKPAVTRCRVLDERHGRLLLELSPLTGRTHQLRAQAAARGVPIAGDLLYEGEAAPRLMLHADRLELVGRPPLVAPVPRVLLDWLEQRTFDFELKELRARLEDAWCLRAPLCADNDTFRVANDEGDQLPGVVVDRYGPYAALSVSSEEAEAAVDGLALGLSELGFSGVYLKRKRRVDPRRVVLEEAAPARPFTGSGAPSPLVVQEGALRARVSLESGLSTGLFVDQRDNRALVRQLAQGTHVLNLFCYTGLFSVAAALGGARQVTSVDVSGRALHEARLNFQANGLDAAAHRFVREDATRWVERLVKRDQRFGLIVLDPPSFSSTGKRGAWSFAKHFGGLVRHCLTLLAPGGRLLAVTNHRQTSLAELRSELRRAAADVGRVITQLKDLPVGLDTPPLSTGPYPSKSALVSVE